MPAYTEKHKIMTPHRRLIFFLFSLFFFFSPKINRALTGYVYSFRTYIPKQKGVWSTMSYSREECSAEFSHHLLLQALGSIPKSRPFFPKEAVSGNRVYLRQLLQKNSAQEARCTAYLQDGSLREELPLDTGVVLYYLFANFQEKSTLPPTTSITFDTIAQKAIRVDFSEKDPHLHSLLDNLYTIAHAREIVGEKVVFLCGQDRMEKTIPQLAPMEQISPLLHQKSERIQEKIEVLSQKLSLCGCDEIGELLQTQKICFETLLASKLQVKA